MHLEQHCTIVASMYFWSVSWLTNCPVYFSFVFGRPKKDCPVSETEQKNFGQSLIFFWSVSLVEGERNWPKVHGHRLYLQLLLGTIDNSVNSLNSKSLRRCWDGNPQAFQSRTAKAQEAARELNIQAKDTFKEEQQKKSFSLGRCCSFLRKCWKDWSDLNEKVMWLCT